MADLAFPQEVDSPFQRKWTDASVQLFPVVYPVVLPHCGRPDENSGEGGDEKLHRGRTFGKRLTIPVCAGLGQAAERVSPVRKSFPHFDF